MTQPYEFTLKLLCSLSHESVIFISASTALAKYTLRDRGALNLLISEQKVKREAGTKTWMIRSREDVASIVSAAAESLVRMLKDFKEKGLITTVKRSIFVEDYNGFLLVSDLRHNAVNQ
jgi:CRP-like cAMP-binding protein